MTQERRSTTRKRHIVTDTLGLLIVVMVTSAALQDRDGGRLVLERAKMKAPSIVLVWADGGYAGKLIAHAHHRFQILVQIIKRTDKRPTFEVLPRRWVIERTNSWLMQTRRLARDYERLPEHAEAMIKWTMIGPVDPTPRALNGPTPVAVETSHMRHFPNTY